MNYLKTLFLFILVYFSIIGWCSNNWFMIWLMMEFSFLFLIGFISIEINYMLTELMMKYFITQVFISLMLIILILFYIFNLNLKINLFLLVVLMMKLGMFPFHFWIIMILGKLNWISFFMMTTFFKLIPILLVYYMLYIHNLNFVLLTSLTAGSLFGFNNTMIQKLMGYSSIVHISWMLLSLMMSLKLFYTYFFIYLMINLMLIIIMVKMNIFYINQFKILTGTVFTKFLFFFLILSLAGFPPMVGFLIKWILVSEVLIFNMKIMMSFMVIFSLFSVIFYFQLFFYIMLIKTIEIKWYKFNYMNNMSFSLLYLILFSYVTLYFFI